MNNPALVLAALIVEATVGYSDRLHARISHPVTWLGHMLAFFERRWNRPQYPRKMLGIVTIVVVAGAAGSVGFAFQRAVTPLPAGGLFVVLAATLGLAQRSLYTHTRAVAAPLERGDLMAARAATACIVGRDVARLDESGISAAALESLAESFNDGVVAPAVWMLIGGLAGLFAYKAINTADSMIGHLEPRWRDFGWAAARTDDFMNLLPARIAGALIAAAGRGGWRVMIADAPKHPSPNAGWPEAAMAGALNIALGGPVSYDGQIHDRAAFGRGASPQAADLRRGLRIYMTACGLLWAVFAIGAFAWPR